MTIKVNLLAWRQIKRKKEREKLIRFTLTGLVLVILICILVDYLLFKQVERQQDTNQRLKNEIAKLDMEIKEVNKIKLQKDRLTKKIVRLQILQDSRIIIVHLFDELIKILPDGIYLNLVKGTGKKITFEGSALSNLDLAQLVQNIEKNPWMQSPNLVEIKKVKPLALTNRFRLNFRLKPMSLHL